MVDKTNPGFIRKVNTSTNQTIALLTYAEIVFNPSVRIQLRNELASNRMIKLFCACHCGNTLEIKISDLSDLLMPDDSLHSSECAQYLRRLIPYGSAPAIAPFTGQTNEFPVSFCWVKRSRSQSLFITNNNAYPPNSLLSLDVLTALINIRAFEHRSRRMSIFEDTSALGTDTMVAIYDMAFEFGKYRIRDPLGNVFHLNQSTQFKNHQPPGTLSFLCARILGINCSYRTLAYLNCEHGNCEHGNGRVTICVDRTKWETCISSFIIPGLPLYICGFVTTLEASTFKRGRYDPRTHKVYPSNNETNRLRHMLKVFVAYHTNEYGLICFSKEEYEVGNKLSAQKIPYTKPYYPLPGIHPLPLLQIDVGGQVIHYPKN